MAKKTISLTIAEPGQSFGGMLEKDEELSLDDLPRLIRLRDKLDEKIDRIVRKKRS